MLLYIIVNIIAPLCGSTKAHGQNSHSTAEESSCNESEHIITPFIVCTDQPACKQNFKATLHRTCAEDAPTDFSSDCIEIPQAY